MPPVEERRMGTDRIWPLNRCQSPNKKNGRRRTRNAFFSVQGAYVNFTVRRSRRKRAHTRKSRSPTTKWRHGVQPSRGGHPAAAAYVHRPCGNNGNVEGSTGRPPPRFRDRRDRARRRRRRRVPRDVLVFVVRHYARAYEFRELARTGARQRSVTSSIYRTVRRRLFERLRAITVVPEPSTNTCAANFR